MKRLGFLYDQNLEFIIDILVPAENMQASFQEAILDDEMIDINRIQGYKVHYVDTKPHIKWDQDTWDAYQKSVESEKNIEESQKVFDELAASYTLSMASDQDAYKMRYLYPDFDPDGYSYKKDDRFLWSQNEKFYKVLQDHTSQNSPDRKPDVAVSLYVEISDPAIEYPEWKQPTGAHDAYHRGDKITFTDGKKYECIAPEGVAVVWDPVTYPAYWQLVE